MVKWGMGREGGQPRTCVSKRGHGLGIINIHDAPRTRPAPAWIVRLLEGTAAEYIEEPASDREKRELIEGQHRVLFWTALAMPAERCRECTDHALRAATSVRTLRQTCPIRSPSSSLRLRSQVPRASRDAHEKARSHGYDSDRPRDERDGGSGDTRTRTHARSHAWRRAHRAANVRKGVRIVRKRTRAAAHHCAAACRRRTLPPGGGPGGPPFGGPGGGPRGGGAPLGGPRGGPGGGPVGVW